LLENLQGHTFKQGFHKKEAALPVILRTRGFNFFFFSNEGNPLEPMHIHVRKGDATAKFWLEPAIMLAGSYEMSAKELIEVRNIIIENFQQIEGSWNEYFRE